MFLITKDYNSSQTILNFQFSGIISGGFGQVSEVLLGYVWDVFGTCFESVWFDFERFPDSFREVFFCQVKQPIRNLQQAYTIVLKQFEIHVLLGEGVVGLLRGFGMLYCKFRFSTPNCVVPAAKVSGLPIWRVTVLS